MKKNLTLAALLIGAATIGHAQTAPRTATAATGDISRAEVKRELVEAFARADTNKDGSISVAEANAAQQRTADQAAANIAARAQQQFAAIDTDKNGQLSPAEFRAAAGKVNLATGEQIVKLIDTNKDGKVTLAEFEAQRLLQFDRADTNRDGKVTLQERQAATARSR